MHRSVRRSLTLHWTMAIALAAATALALPAAGDCPLGSDECAGVLRDAAQLGSQLDRLRGGERVIEIRGVEGAGGERATQVSGALIVGAPPAAVWAVLTDFGSWPHFVPHLASVQVGADGDPHRSILLRQDTSVWGFAFSATTRRQLDSDRHILWDQLVPAASNDVEGLSGFWQVLDLGGGRSLLRFQSRIALDASLPDALESWLVERGAPDALDAFAVEIERRQHAATGPIAS